ncbi:MAG TPA: type II secretion system F family protein [Stellaceae bacterium]|nr:type II secretion system F family protein [Stellaceae bacterium]
MPAFLDHATSIALLCGLGIALTFGLIVLALSDGSGHRRLKRRLAVVRDQARGLVTASAVAARSLSRRESATPGIDRIARRWLPRKDALGARLARTGMSISIGQFAIAMLATGAVVSGALAAAAPIGLPASVLVGLFVGVALPHMVVGYLGKRRVNAFIGHFPEAIDLMVRALRSGLPISEAIINAGHEIPGPVGAELRLIEGGMRMGRDLERLLWDTAKRIDVPEFRFFVIALSVQRETGGNLAETLGNLSDVLRKRRQMRAKVRAMASETRATTAILGGLPVVVIVLLMMTSPNYLAPMYTDIRGIFLDAVALAMLGTGVFIMTRMAHFEI